MPAYEDSAAESPQRRMIGTNGDTGRSPRHGSQARQPQLGASHSARPALGTEFELRVRHLQLTPEMYTSPIELRTWCEYNRNRCYVPEWLLEEWSITVDPTFSDHA
jgi:hypothetical protein